MIILGIILLIIGLLIPRVAVLMVIGVVLYATNGLTYY